jgi:lipopolysaccharide transport system permease protein
MRPSSLTFRLNAALTYQLIKREILGRYRGSLFGLLWSFINPLLMLTVYTFVFSRIFKTKWGKEDGDTIQFALMLFTGLIVFNLFSECISRAPQLIVNNLNYVKKVVFPLEILSLVAVGSSLFHAAVSFLVLFFFLVLSGHSLHATLLFAPLIIAPLLPLILGLSWFLSSLGVFIRDIGQVIGLLTSVLMFLSPIFYPASVLPESIQKFLFLNPLTFIIEQTRSVILLGNMPDWAGLTLYFIPSLFISWAGFLWFQKTRKGFADVL